jgi:hypothetical protein
MKSGIKVWSPIANTLIKDFFVSACVQKYDDDDDDDDCNFKESNSIDQVLNLFFKNHQFESYKF